MNSLAKPRRLIFMISKGIDSSVSRIDMDSLD